MTVKIAKTLFLVYQTIFLSTNRTCRFTPTCSQYAIESIEKYGIASGSWLALRRLASCHPLSKRPYYDSA